MRPRLYKKIGLSQSQKLERRLEQLDHVTGEETEPVMSSPGIDDLTTEFGCTSLPDDTVLH